MGWSFIMMDRASRRCAILMYAAVSAGVLLCLHACISRCVEGYISSRGTLAAVPIYYCRGHIIVSMPVILRGDFDEQRFPLLKNHWWRGLRMARDSLGPRVRMWRMVLNGINHRAVEWTPYDYPVLQAIVPSDFAASHPFWGLLGAHQHIPLRPLNIDVMHRYNDRWGKGEWYPTYLRGWYNMWRGREQSRLVLQMAVGGVQPSRQYLLWYYQWAHVILMGYRDPAISAPGVIPDYVRDGISEAPDMVQPEDGELPEVHPRVVRRPRAPV
ncbi:hypothetical protein PIB30_071548 [Stylosanthes scabra]|uniref:Aminotransferase-like plant mobile domain-containing protein n=1 Tax=Stylosanthes scabra TaxID=79078 RepID=A0ABU6ZMG8_9FABA|nr:hypothetical protein [Stylosanthes scabra]